MDVVLEKCTVQVDGCDGQLGWGRRVLTIWTVEGPDAIGTLGRRHLDQTALRNPQDFLAGNLWVSSSTAHGGLYTCHTGGINRGGVRDGMFGLDSTPLDLPSGTYLTVATPTGEEIVPEGWDDEPTRIQAVDPLLLELCAGRQRPTRRFHRVEMTPPSSERKRS